MFTRRRGVYAAFTPQGHYLTIGTAFLPLKGNYSMLQKFKNMFGAVPDVILLKELDDWEDWKVVKADWKFQLQELQFKWITSEPDTVNRKRMAENYERLKTEHQLIKGEDLLPEPKKRALVPLT